MIAKPVGNLFGGPVLGGRNPRDEYDEDDDCVTHFQDLGVYHLRECEPSDENAQHQEYDTGDGERGRCSHFG